MRKSRGILIAIGVFVSLVYLIALVPDSRAQSAFTGVVKDQTGAVLPGVAVEAASPAVIGGPRSTVTDERGAYTLLELPPGAYTLTFTLPGFRTVKRDVDLQASFVATINAEMTVGATEETVTVQAEAPVVDLESNTKADVLPRTVLDSVPTAHTLQSIGQLVVGVNLTLPDVGGSQAMQQTYFTVHGAGAAQTSVMVDGMIVNGLQGDGAVQAYPNEGAFEQMVYQVGGGTVDSPSGGLKINNAPKEGGNAFHGSLFAGFEGSGLQSDNLSPFLKSHGVAAVDKIGTYRDIDTTIGGPIKKDKLWFFGSGRFFTVDKPVADAFFAPQGSASYATGYANCLKGTVACQQGVDTQRIYNATARLTWQVSARNKLSAYMDRQFKKRGDDVAPGVDPATAGIDWNSPIYEISSLKWTSTISNLLLVEGGYSANLERYNNLYLPGIAKPWGSPEWLAGAMHHDLALETFTNAGSRYQSGNYPDRHNLQGALSYVRNRHNIKIGLQDSWGAFNQTSFANADLYQNYLNGKPFSVTVLGTPAHWQAALNMNMGIFAQDAWTFKRMTLTYGLRFDYISEQVTGQPAQSGRFAHIPAYGDLHMPIWRTWSPRFAIVYDLFGNGKTAVRFGFNRYDYAATTTIASLFDPANTANLQQTLPWTDVDGDGIARGTPGCVYKTPGCDIDFSSLPKNFGVVSLSKFDPHMKNPYMLQYNLGVTHELFPGVAVTAEWFHTNFKDLLEYNNVLRPGTVSGSNVNNPSYRPVTVFSPIDGTPLTVYDTVSSAVARSVAYVVGNDSNLNQFYNDFEFNFNAKLSRGITLFGGSATDRSISNSCSGAATNPTLLLFCDGTNNGIPWRTQFKLAGTYGLPWWGLQASGALQALPGYLLGTQPLTSGGFVALSQNPNGLTTFIPVTPASKYTVCPGDSAAHGCAVGAPMIPGMTLGSLSIPLIAPGTELTPRLTQLDISLNKQFNFERVRIRPRFDLFNALNSSAYYTVRTLAYSAAPGAAYRHPGSILQGRIARFGFNLDF